MNEVKTTLLLFGLAIVLPGVTLADQSSSANYILIYSEADLSTAESVQKLHAKILRTARSHCPSYFSTRSLADLRRCVRDVVENLVRVIDHPQLTAYAQGENVLKLSSQTDRSDSQS